LLFDTLASIRRPLTVAADHHVGEIEK